MAYSLKSAAESYADFRGQHLPGALVLREPADFHEPIPISERLVQAIWADQLFETSRLQTRDHKSLRIINPGRWNVESGPDFSGAQIEMDGKSICGAIEIHLDSNGWKDHGHASNPLYNQVILDVCLWDISRSAPLHTASGHRVPQLILQPYLQCALDELVESLDIDHYPFSPNRAIAPSSPLLRLSMDEIAQHVTSAGLYRFEQKSARMAETINELGSNQAAYLFLAGALGYKHNKWAFQQIATAMPLARLFRKSSADEKIEALLDQTANFHLRMGQVRPANHPERRLAALALLAHSQPDLASWFATIGKSRQGEMGRPPKLEHPFWSWHSHRRAPRTKKPLELIGRARWLEIVVNVILPFCHAEAVRRDDTDSAAKICDAYAKLPSPSDNLSSRQIAYDLRLPQPRKALEQQGLIQLYQDFDLLIPESSSTNS